jgi:hypothetical protein
MLKKVYKRRLKMGNVLKEAKNNQRLRKLAKIFNEYYNLSTSEISDRKINILDWDISVFIEEDEDTIKLLGRKNGSLDIGPLGTVTFYPFLIMESGISFKEIKKTLKRQARKALLKLAYTPVGQEFLRTETDLLTAIHTVI